MGLKIHKFRDWIRSYIDNKNTQRYFKTTQAEILNIFVV
ncbi:hypothetical protein HPHPP15B_0401 [Helicobacter pylori Hp P-15b]|uniref:Uncharacterized protein n=1 Tax=Helicobacter pylori Hp P-15 TaxID=992080 RepID=J0QBP9_HELPX|nr:hypothetical protein HPHPP15_0400 [Helicobacter pylori Hp P-15]EJC33026.1 hypothetical protein HPHPP15B_0401 [Helicobacter pylori Hp P-15b]